MAIATAVHGVNQTPSIFVADGVLAIEGEVVVRTDMVGNGNHGGLLGKLRDTRLGGLETLLPF